MTILAGTLAVLLMAATLLPMLPLSHGLVRIGDFPRQQVLVIALAACIAAVVWNDGSLASAALATAFAAVAAIQAVHVLRFTPLWRKQSARYDPARDHGRPFRLVTSNVKMSNRQYGRLIAELEQHDPDIVVLMEVDEGWRNALSGVLERYPEVVARPQDNSYGMILASRFRLSDTSVDCLLTDGVLSIITTVHLEQAGFDFRLYAIHPEPPVPHHGSEGRDGETALVALKVRAENLPVLVTGDLNDVAWSGTTHRFRRVSRLLDPRIGRKVFSTFDARFPVMRWPLDHLFHSPQFRLKAMERLPACGSDHFPVMFDMVLCPDGKAETKPEEADEADMSRARDLADQARERKEKPIGTNWEG
ncbi:MAG: endonuclease/exonuclease/phosphatase family protein [Rhizobiaceae bacterium]